MLNLIRYVLILTALAGPAVALAQSAESTLSRIAETGTFRIGFVPDAAPMSFLDKNGVAVGYSIDLCKHIATAVRQQLGLEELDIVYEPLPTMRGRIAAIESGAVDIECGATTVTLSRRERVDFTLMTFITGGALISRKADPVRTVEGMAGKRIAVINETTTEANLRAYLDSNEFESDLREVGTREEGLAALANESADAFASDHAMLVGLAYLSGRNDYAITADIFSFEPYALMVARGDDDFRLAADRALASLYRSGRIRRIYHNWFGRFGLPMSPVISAMFEFQAVAN